MRGFFCWIVGVAAVVLIGTPLAAQGQGGVALEITLEDELGGVLVGATVSLEDAVGGEREAVTNAEGRATFEGLPPGEYELKAESPGFRELEQMVTIETDRPRPMRLQLEIEVTEIVDVTELRRPLPERQNIDQNADAFDIDDDILLGVPMSIRGDRIVQFLSRFMNPATGSSSIVIDGQEVSRLNLPPRAIDEIVVNKNPYSAEYRRPGRARVEVISQDGSESHHHADATFVFGDSALSARNPFVREKPDIQEWVGEMGFSGPLSGINGSYLFAAEVGADRTTGVVNAVTPAGAVSTFVPERQGETYWTGRLDLEPSDRVDLIFRYEYDRETERDGGVGGLVLPELASNTDSTSQDLWFVTEQILSAGFVHVPQVKISHQVERNGELPGLPMVIVHGAFEGGVNQSFKEATEVEVDFQDTATVIHGTHTFRFGGRFSPSFFKVTDRSNFGGTYEFSSLDTFEAGQPFVYRVTQGNPDLSYGIHTAETFFQDEIKLRPDFTLSLGVRYDWESIVEDHNNLAPRVAFAFAPGSRRTALRGGSGIFYQRLGRAAWEQVEFYGGNRLQALVINNPTYPNALAGGGATLATPTLYQFAPTMKSSYLIQTGIGVDQELWYRTSFSAEFLHIRGYDLFRVRDLNAPVAGTGLRPDPTFQNVIQIEPTGRMRANALHLTFNGRIGGDFEGNMVYTYSRAHDDTRGAGSAGDPTLVLPINSHDLRQEWGRADYDRRHRFSMAGVYEFPGEFQIGAILDVLSGLPYEITTGFDDNGDGEANDRPIGFRRNAGQGPKFVQLDIRLKKTFDTGRPLRYPQADPGEFELFFDVFNVLNTINYTDIIGVQSSPLFGLPNRAEKGRQLQAGLAYSF